MEKEQNNKVLEKESNAHCVSKIKSKLNTKSFCYSTTRWSTYLDPAGITRKLPSRISSIGPSDHRSRSLSAAMSLNPSNLPSITPTTFPSDVPSEKPVMLVL